MTIGDNIRKLRKEKKLTQKQLGELCGMYESQIRKYELGKANPKLDTIRKIASALGAYMNELIVDWSEYSIDELGQDFANGSDTTNTSDSKEEQMRDLLFLLNESGQDKALEQVELLTKIPEYQAEISSSKDIIFALHDNGDLEELPDLNAASPRTDIERPEGVDTSDDNFMDDESF